MDGISGIYFAQAREYRPQDGRFGAEDLIGGDMIMPMTLNRYGYCWGNPLIWSDLDGLYPYFTAAGGIEAHEKLQDRFLRIYPGRGYVEFPVVGYPYSDTGRGRIDILLDMNGVYEVYEIKPISHYMMGNDEGRKQRQGYIDALKTQNYVVNPYGNTFNPSGYRTSSKLVQGYDIKYYTFPDDPGMIYYGYVKKPRPSAQKDKRKEAQGNVIEFEQVAESIGAGVAAIGAGYIIYRVIRFTISLFPPMWWSIPLNAACP